MSFPVLTICGSMRFWDGMLTVAQYFTRKGVIILAPFVVENHATLPDTAITINGDGYFPKFPAYDRHSDNPHFAAERKTMLDAMHRSKIDMSQGIIVVTDHTRYIGDSTRSEIHHASTTGKKIARATVQRGELIRVEYNLTSVQVCS